MVQQRAERNATLVKDFAEIAPHLALVDYNLGTMPCRTLLYIGVMAPLYIGVIEFSIERSAIRTCVNAGDENLSRAMPDRGALRHRLKRMARPP